MPLFCDGAEQCALLPLFPSPCLVPCERITRNPSNANLKPLHSHEPSKPTTEQSDTACVLLSTTISETGINAAIMGSSDVILIIREFYSPN